jgi:glycerophosphoryl diester phosphodiesterase
MSETFFDVSAFVYAHRGLWGGPRVPENSAAAFYSARTQGVGIELDVRLSSDGIPFVFHDRTLERMCGRSDAIDGLPAHELEHILLSNGYPIPQLGDVLDIMENQPVLIELKVDVPGGTAIADVVAGILRGRGGKCTVMSFDEATVARLCRIIEDRPIGLLIPPEPFVGVDVIRTMAARGRAMGCDYFGPHLSSLEAVKDATGGLPLVTWTVRTAEELRLAREHSAAPIFEGFSAALAKSS